MTSPLLSIILVCPSGWPDLVLPLPGIQAQTIASDIELILVTGDKSFAQEAPARINGLHSVRIIETKELIPRGAAAAVAVPFAEASFIGLHENHSRAEAGTYEAILAAMGDGSAAIAPVFYCPNTECGWAGGCSILTHSHAAAPVDSLPRQHLILHHAVYRADLLRPRAEELAKEDDLQFALAEEGHIVRFLPGTVLWHLEAARPAKVLRIGFTIGRQFGWKRSRAWSLPIRVGRACLLPAITAITLRRYLAALMSLEDLSLLRRWVAPQLPFIAAAFALGEIIGYFFDKDPWPRWADEHEFEVFSRLHGYKPERRLLRDAMLKTFPEDEI